MRTAQRLTREEKKAQTRERLIEAAARVFAEKGFAATSLDEVADAAGLTKGAVYSNFENKEDLVRAVLQASQDRMSGISDVAAASESIEEQQAIAARLFSERIAQEQQRDAFLLLLDFTTYALRNSAVHADLLARRRSGRKEIAAMIDGRSPPNGGFKTDADRAALIFEVVGNGIAFERLIDPEGVPDDLFDCLLPVLIDAFESGRL